MKYIFRNVFSRPGLLVLVFLLLSAGLPAGLFAAEWRVVPIRLDFSQKVKSGVVAVHNTGDEALHVSVTAKTWRQDEAGQDQYSDAPELIFFPKSITIKPRSERVVRVGIKAPAIKQEKAYRLFITEEKAPAKNSSQVAVALRFGIPVFAKPLEEQIAGDIADVQVADGTLAFSIRNRGNAHFRTTRIEVIGKDASGQAVFTEELKGWYLLAGADRPYRAPIPQDRLSSLATIDIQIATDRMELFKSLAFDGTAQVPPQVE